MAESPEPRRVHQATNQDRLQPSLNTGKPRGPEKITGLSGLPRSTDLVADDATHHLRSWRQRPQRDSNPCFQDEGTNALTLLLQPIMNAVRVRFESESQQNE